jgi:hypothetical protein
LLAGNTIFKFTENYAQTVKVLAQLCMGNFYLLVKKRQPGTDVVPAG